MVVATVTFHRAGGVSRFAAEFCQAASPERIFAAQIALHAQVEPPETLGDPLLAAALLPAMFLAESLEVRHDRLMSVWPETRVFGNGAEH